MNQREALKLLGLFQMPRNEADLRSAFALKQKPLIACLQFPKKGQARQQLIAELGRLKQALETLLLLVSPSPPLPAPLPGPRPIPPKPVPTGGVARLRCLSLLILSYLLRACIVAWSIATMVLKALRALIPIITGALAWAYYHPRTATACLAIMFTGGALLFWTTKSQSATTTASPSRTTAQAPALPRPFTAVVTTLNSSEEKPTQEPSIGDSMCTVRILCFPAADVFANDTFVGESPGPSSFRLDAPQIATFLCRAKDGCSCSFREPLNPSQQYVFKVNVCQKKYAVENPMP